MMDLNSEEKKFFLQLDIVEAMKRMFARIQEKWTEAVLVDADSDRWLFLQDVNIEDLLSVDALFFIVPNQTCIDQLDDPHENDRHFYVGCRKIQNVVLDSTINNEKDFLDPKVRASPFDATICLSSCWLVIVQLPWSNQEQEDDWNQWSLEVVQELSRF